MVEISIGNMWAVAYINHLIEGKSKIVVYPKLFASKEEADAFSKEQLGNDYVVNHVFFNNK